MTEQNEPFKKFFDKLKSDAAIKSVTAVYIIPVRFQGAEKFPEYYSSEKGVIHLLGFEDNEGKAYAFHLTKDVVNAIAPDLVKILTLPLQAAVDNTTTTENVS